MTHLDSRIPVPRNSMPGNLHDRLFSIMDQPKRFKSNVQQNRFSWLSPGNLICKSSRLISSDCIYIGMK